MPFNYPITITSIRTYKLGCLSWSNDLGQAEIQCSAWIFECEVPSRYCPHWRAVSDPNKSQSVCRLSISILLEHWQNAIGRQKECSGAISVFLAATIIWLKALQPHRESFHSEQFLHSKQKLKPSSFISISFSYFQKLGQRQRHRNFIFAANCKLFLGRCCHLLGKHLIIREYIDVSAITFLFSSSLHLKFDLQMIFPPKLFKSVTLNSSLVCVESS